MGLFHQHQLDIASLAPFTEALGLPSALARRQARNIQLVLMEEAHIGRVGDPAGGAWFLETLTDQMARSAWAKFQVIEAKGGIIAALEAGTIQADIAEAADAQAALVAQGQQQILGVTKFRNADLSAIEIETVDGAQFAVTAADPRKPGPDSKVGSMTPHRLAEQFEVAQ
jgi:methylmalonyl-CoA mutase